jgi:hypothetical protein
VPYNPPVNGEGPQKLKEEPQKLKEESPVKMWYLVRVKTMETKTAIRIDRDDTIDGGSSYLRTRRSICN